MELISRFPLTQAESIYLLNSRWGHITLVKEDELAYHEIPEFWAKDFYWGLDTSWWQPEVKRKQLHLDRLKPVKVEKESTYELWETDGNDNYIFVEGNEVKGLIESYLVNHAFQKTWETHKRNYNEGLTALHSYKGWVTYMEI